MNLAYARVRVLKIDDEACAPILSFRHHCVELALNFWVIWSHVPFSRHDNSLSHPILPHRRVGIFCDSKQMWFQLPTFPPAVRLDDFRPVEGDALEGVDGN